MNSSGLIEQEQQNISITDAFRQMYNEVSDDRWRQVASQYPDQYLAFFSVKYKTLKDTHARLFSTVLKHQLDDIELRRVIFEMLDSRDDVTLRKTHTKDQVDDRIVDPLYEKHLYPKLKLAEAAKQKQKK